MSENTTKERALTRVVIAEMLSKNFVRLPDIDKKLFNYGPVYLGANAGLVGLVANSLYRRVLNVTQARITSSLPMAVLPFLATMALYSGAVCAPLMSGDLDCPSCAQIRGALVGVVGGTVYPVLIALPLNFAIATTYSTAVMPEKGNVLRYWVDISRPVWRKMRAVVVLQAVFGSYLGTRHFQSYTKLVEITFNSNEELKD